MSVLKYQSKRSSKICLLDFFHINPIISNTSALHIIKTVDQINDCRLSCASRTDKGNFLTRLGIETDLL